MKVSFYGVRGCIPSPGAEFNRYGGNTMCVTVEGEAGELLVLDAGTGVIELGKRLMAGAFGRGEGEASLFLTHAHWDHIQGFPFFVPVYVPGNHIQVFGPNSSPQMLESILEGQMNPHFMPIQSLGNLGANIELRSLMADEGVSVGALKVCAHSVPHGTMESLALKIEEGDTRVVFVPDAGYEADALEPSLRSFYQGADLLIHDTTYTSEDRATRISRGYASAEIAASVAAQCGVRCLVPIHYDQDYTDEQVDALVERCREVLDSSPGGASVDLVAAKESLVLDVPQK
ncbi:MAG: MBL fold metallo-hydrolase [Deltaproteobacteria bacterium]|nr:MBL fold metallo-hydrolase [Deltaproteobacteria bacterium]